MLDSNLVLIRRGKSSALQGIFLYNFCVVLYTVCFNFVLFYILFVLCRSVYYLCVNVYCTTAAGWKPSCS